MRSVMLLALVVLAEAGCLHRPSERVVDPRFKTPHFRTLAIIAGGSRRNDIIMAQRTRERVKKSGVAEVVSVKGRWDTERQLAGEICGPDKTPPIDAFVIVQGDNLVLWDCATQRVAWEADGAYEGVDYMTTKLLEYLKSDG